MPRFQALECISAVLYGGGCSEDGREPGKCLPLPPPSSPAPLPGASPPLSSSVSRVWSFRAVWVTYGMGRGHGWMRWDGASAGKGKGHWRLSSVSDRENAVTTSSAPESQQEYINFPLDCHSSPPAKGQRVCSEMRFTYRSAPIELRRTHIRNGYAKLPKLWKHRYAPEMRDI